MSEALATSADLAVINRGETAVVVLPRLQLGPWRYSGLFLIVFGLVFAGFPLAMIGSMTGMLRGPGAAGVPLLFFAILSAVAVPFVLAGCAPLFIGLFILACGRFDLQVTPRQLRTVMRVGPFHWTRKRPLPAVTGLRVARHAPQEAPNMTGVRGAALLADCSARKPLLLAAGYPQALLVTAANLLVEELQRRNYTQILRPGTAGAPVPAVSVEPAPRDDATAEDDSEASAHAGGAKRAEVVPAEPEALAPPPNSKIICLTDADTLTFVLPRTGFRGAAGFFLFFSIFWNAVSWAVFSVFLVDFIRQPNAGEVLGLLFMLVFVAIGVATFLGAIQLAYRKAVILATRDALVVTQKGPVRNREFQWAPGQISSIRREHSGTKINDRPLSELRIYSQDAGHKGFFDGRDEAELNWLAASLREFYRLVLRSGP
jgi:hypothetical protein